VNTTVLTPKAAAERSAAPTFRGSCSGTTSVHPGGQAAQSHTACRARPLPEAEGQYPRYRVPEEGARKTDAWDPREGRTARIVQHLRRQRAGARAASSAVRRAPAISAVPVRLIPFV